MLFNCWYCKWNSTLLLVVGLSCCLTSMAQIGKMDCHGRRPLKPWSNHVVSLEALVTSIHMVDYSQLGCCKWILSLLQRGWKWDTSGFEHSLLYNIGNHQLKLFAWSIDVLYILSLNVWGWLVGAQKMWTLTIIFLEFWHISAYIFVKMYFSNSIKWALMKGIFLKNQVVL
jgi:hypothetical protein